MSSSVLKSRNIEHDDVEKDNPEPKLRIIGFFRQR